MKYLYSWVKDYYKTEKPAEETGEDLVLLGSDVEEIASFPQIDERVIAVKITKIEPHPNADKLRLSTVTDGEKQMTLVCGASNIEVGQIVPMAQVGCKVRDFVIEEAEIRGVKSPGMLMSPRELEISSEHAGVHILPEETKLGTKVRDLLVVDFVLDLEITPNRGDLLSHFGIARDLCAKAGKKLEKPSLYSHSEANSRRISRECEDNPEQVRRSFAGAQDDSTESGEKVCDQIKVSIETEKCPLYLAKVIKGVKIAESPDWLKERLIAVGAKPINNVVDVTNYIMLDLGHPLHAFDKSKMTQSVIPSDPAQQEVEGSKTEVKIIVKEFKADTDVVTLDDVARVVLPGMIGIWDAQMPVAIAGVMGLKNSEVDQDTTEIVLEAAVFDRKSIRKTAKLLSLKTEASARFERGVDADGVRYAIDKAAKLISEIAGGEICEGVVQADCHCEQSEAISEKIKIEYEKINSYANLNLENEQIDQILISLGFKIESGEAVIPSWRHDIEIWQDLAEEIYRMNGLDKISKLALPEMQKPAPSDYYKKEKMKDYLVELGLDEAISYTFLSDQDVVAAKLDPSDLLEVANPVQDENRYLRNSLIPGLLKAVAKNPSFDDVEFFELGNVFSKDDEWTSLGIVTSGKSSRPIEKIVESLCGMFNFSRDSFKVYQIEQSELVRFKIKKPLVAVAQARISDLIESGQFDDLRLEVTDSKIVYRPISKFPPAKRDLAFVVDKNIESDEVKKLILETAPEAVLVELFDEFESDKLGFGKKSVAFHIYLQELDKTMSDADADKIISKIVDELKNKFQAELRS